MEEEGEVNIVVDAAVVHGDREDVGVVLVEGGDGDSVAIGEGIDVVVASGPDSDPLNDDNDDDAVITPSGSVRVTKVSASQQKKKEMTDKLYAAIVDFKADIFKSVRACAKAHDVSHVQLGRMLKDPELQYKGRGRASKRGAGEGHSGSYPGEDGEGMWHDHLAGQDYTNNTHIY